MKAFKVTGSFRMGRKPNPFAKEVAAADKKAAEEVVLSDLGSKHKVKRYDITIDKVTEMKPEEVTDLTVSFKIGA